VSYKIVDRSIRVGKLRAGMVVTVGGRPRVVISVRRRKSGSAFTALVETGAGTEVFATKSDIDVWHIIGKPFLMVLPAEDCWTRMPDGGSLPPVHDAAGIVPVWRGPTRVN
jgi:hypothetical protein